MQVQMSVMHVRIAKEMAPDQVIKHTADNFAPFVG